MVIKNKSINKLNKKVNEYRDKKVIKFLNKKGYSCEYTKEIMKKVINQLSLENKKVMIYKENEKLQKINEYYKYSVKFRIILEKC